jgi:TonB family protein
MKCILSVFVVLLFSFSAFSQSDVQKEKFANGLFKDFKQGKLDAVKARFVDSKMMDILLLDIEKKDPEFFNKIPKDSVRKQRLIAQKRLDKSLNSLYKRFTKVAPDFKHAQIKKVTWSEKSIRSIPTLNMNIDFIVDGQEGWFSIKDLSYDQRRKKIFIVSNKVKGEIIAEERKSERIYEEDLLVGEDVEMVAPPPPPKKEVKARMELDEYDAPAIAMPKVQNEVFDFVEQMPEFPGGQEAMMKFITKNINYPQIAIENGISGKVYAKFVVGRDGTIRDIKILRDIGGGCGQEVKRLIKSMPNWKPGMQGGKAVPVYFTLPVSFNLK